MSVKLINQKVIDGFMTVVDPIARVLASLNIHPNAVTVFGLILSVVSGYEFYTGHFVWGGIFLVLAGVCDVLDGRLARSTGKVSKYGALFDSSVDRFSEVFIFMGLAGFYSEKWLDALLVFTLGGSMLTSYVRARAEGLGIACKVGIMQRPERLTYLAVGAILSIIWHGFMVIAIVIVAVFSNITAVHRIIHTYRNTKDTADV